MAYADQKMSGNKVTAIIIVALIHVVLGYALVTGLAYDVVKKAVEKVTTVDIKEPEKPKEPPPPPPKQKQVTPPPVAPPVRIDVAPAPAQIETVRVAPPPAPIQLAPAAPAPPAPAPRAAAVAATPRGNPQSWVTNDDYPARAMREERQGVTGFRLAIGTDGKVVGCQTTRSSGSPDLDETVCSLMTRRARFKPAIGADGSPATGTYSGNFRWEIPKE